MSESTKDKLSGGNNNRSNSSKGEKPILENSQYGISAWINKAEESGNAYFSVRIELFGSTFALFPSNDGVQDIVNNLYDLVEERGLNVAGGDQ